MSYITGELALRNAWSETDQAIRTVPSSNTSFTVELSHADGDSVYDIPMATTVNQASGSVDCSSMREACLYGTGTVEISPDGGTTWFTLAMTALTPIAICGNRIKITGSGQVYIRG